MAQWNLKWLVINISKHTKQKECHVLNFEKWDPTLNLNVSATIRDKAKL
jgi:hypothetical protein